MSRINADFIWLKWERGRNRDDWAILNMPPFPSSIERTLQTCQSLILIERYIQDLCQTLNVFLLLGGYFGILYHCGYRLPKYCETFSNKDCTCGRFGQTQVGLKAFKTTFLFRGNNTIPYHSLHSCFIRLPGDLLIDRSCLKAIEVQDCSQIVKIGAFII